MPAKRLLVALLLLAGFALVTVEDTLLHTDDGCAVETHCNACLLRLATPGVVTEAFALPMAAVVIETLSSASVPEPESPAPRAAASRGPPTA